MTARALWVNIEAMPPTGQGPAARPRNHLGEPATRTPDEAVARLKEKISKNHGGGNRQRIQAKITEDSTARL